MHTRMLSLSRENFFWLRTRRCRVLKSNISGLVNQFDFGAPIRSQFISSAERDARSGIFPLMTGCFRRDAFAVYGLDSLRRAQKSCGGPNGFVAVNCVGVPNRLITQSCKARWMALRAEFICLRRHCSALAHALGGSQCRRQSVEGETVLEKIQNRRNAHKNQCASGNRIRTPECNGQFRWVGVSVGGSRDMLRLRWLRRLLLLLQPLTSEQRHLLQLLRLPHEVRRVDINEGNPPHDALVGIQMPKMQFGWKLIPILREAACSLQRMLDKPFIENNEDEMPANEGSNAPLREVYERIQHCAAEMLYFLPTMNPALTSHALLRVSQIERMLYHQRNNLWRETHSHQHGSITEGSSKYADWDVLMLLHYPLEKLLQLVFDASALHLTDMCLRSYQASDLAVLLQALAIHMGSPQNTHCSVVLNKGSMLHCAELRIAMERRKRSLVMRACDELPWKVGDGTLEAVATATSAIAAIGIKERKVYVHLTHRLAEIILNDGFPNELQLVDGQPCNHREYHPPTDIREQSFETPVSSTKTSDQLQHSLCKALRPERQLELLALMAKALASVGHDDLPLARILLLYLMDTVHRVMMPPSSHILDSLNRKEILETKHGVYNHKCLSGKQQPPKISSRTLSNVAFFVTRYLTLQQQKVKQQRVREQCHFSFESTCTTSDTTESDEGVHGPYFISDEELILVGKTLLAPVQLTIPFMRPEQLCSTLRFFAAVTASLHNAASIAESSSLSHSRMIIGGEDIYQLHQGSLMLLANIIQGLLRQGFETLSEAAISNVLHSLVSLAPLLSGVSGFLTGSNMRRNQGRCSTPELPRRIINEQQMHLLLRHLHELRLECVSRCVCSLVRTTRSTSVFLLMLQSAEAAVNATVSRGSQGKRPVPEGELHSLSKIRDALRGPPVRRHLSHARSGSKCELERLLSRINKSICIATQPLS